MSMTIELGQAESRIPRIAVGTSRQIFLLKTQIVLICSLVEVIVTYDTVSQDFHFKMKAST